MKKRRNDETHERILPEGWPRCLAHRGAPSLAPENTLASFALARSLGAQGVEFDVHLAATGELVVTHDHWLDRVTGIHRRVEDTPFADLRAIDAGSFFNALHPERASRAFAAERIPTLDMALETLGPDCFCDIELKATSGNAERLARSVAETLARHGRRECIVSSFNPLALLAYRRHGAHPTAAIYCPYPSVPFFLRHRECLFLSGASIRKPARETALASPTMETGAQPVIVWTVDERSEGDRLFAGGVNSIITNRIQDFV
ncbi:MAG TPA: glycerophosphodiester phosphodiesterase family protein [Treponemataceae bacterium]|nr:glycerophosphodiester phosphodiesterase family protein [Treponemataceae bacterium]